MVTASRPHSVRTQRRQREQHSARSTWKQTIRAALLHNGYECEQAVPVGERLGGASAEKADFVAADGSRRVIVSLMAQHTTGTGEEKVPFEVISLDGAVRASAGAFSRAYLVLAGDGWRLREFYLNDGLAEHLKRGQKVKILWFDDFIARVSDHRL